MSFISNLWSQSTFPNGLQLPLSGKSHLGISTDELKNGSSNSGVTTGSHALSRTRKPISESSLLTLERYQADIQRRFQALLDAQAERLLATIGDPGGDTNNASDVASSSGTSTRPSEYSKVVPVRQPAKSRLTLRGARKEIGIALNELAAVKDQEKEIYNIELRDKTAIASQIQEWEDRKTSLNREVEKVRVSEPNSRLQSLQSESQSLQEHITALENQLMELKSQQNAVKLELSRVDNSIQSRLSSYNESLRLLDNEVNQFLNESPSTLSGLLGEETSYTMLPPSRRTLKMALDHTNDEIAALRERQRVSGEEWEATRQGQIVWRDVVSAVTKLEQHLRQCVQSSKGTISSEDTSSVTLQLQEAIDEVIVDLHSKLKLAEARGWKLLVCCIGAELEALNQGRTLLDVTSPRKTPHTDPEERQFEESRIDAEDRATGFKASRGGNHGLEGAVRKSSVSSEDPAMHREDFQTSQRPLLSKHASLSGGSLRRGSNESTRHRPDLNSTNWPPRQENEDLTRSSPMIQSETVEGSFNRRSLDSFRRRNDRPFSRAYRPHEEPAPDLLVTQPEFNDVE